jgi:putative PEP-CTERM system histidine kinase
VPAPGTLGYLIAALAYGGLFVLLLVAWEGRGQGARLVVASLVTALWAVIMALFATGDVAPAAPVFLAETMRYAAWLFVLAGLVQSGGFPRLLARISYLAWAAVLVAGLVALFTGRTWIVQASLLGGVLLPLIGLVLLEQIYRNSNTSGRWSLRYFYLAVGGMFVYDIFLYSQAFLLQTVTAETWFARGYVVALAVPFIALAARRNPNWSLQVFVSRDVVFYTTSFMAVGAYLVLMAAGGYLIRLAGGSWGPVVQVVFFVAAGAMLAVLVGSSALRRRLKVFLVKHFYRHKYEYREEWLRFIATLSDEHDGEDTRVTGLRAVAQIISSPGAAFLRFQQGAAAFIPTAGWPSESLLPGNTEALEASPELVELLAELQWVVDLDEYRRDRDAYEQVALPGWLLSRTDWRLLVPVLLRDGLYGVLLLKNPPAGFELTFEDRDLLKTVARHVAAHFSQYESEQRLSESRQFEAYSRLTAFLMHDLKNAVGQLNLVVTNAKRHRSNPAFIDDAIETVANSAERIGRLIEQLQRGGAMDNTERVVLDEVARAAVERNSAREPAPVLQLETNGLAVAAGRERLTSVIEHVIRNAQDATPSGGRVVVRVAGGPEQAVIEVTDSGQGMTPEFLRERLFRPFDSTKGAKGMGIGAYQTREYARSLGGDVEVESSPGRGTVFRIILPAAGLQAVA